MSAALGFIIMAEVLVAMFVLWGFLHEELFLRFEENMAAALRRRFPRKKRAARRLRVVKNSRSARRGPDRSAA